MKSEWKVWRVTANPINGRMMYGVYRVIDTGEVDHSGNREHRGGWTEDRKVAEALAKRFNREEDANGS